MSWNEADVSRGLAGRLALVTGAARGLGLAQAQALARAGAHVVLFDLGEADRADTPGAGLTASAAAIEATGGSVMAVAGDVTRLADLERAVGLGRDRFGRAVDILVANAGIGARRDSWDMAEADWARVVDVNLGGVWRSARAVIPGMIEAGGGRLIFVSSVVVDRIGRLDPAPAYVASKAGIRGLGRALATELGPHGITCNAIAPGNVQTDLNRADDHGWWTDRQCLPLAIRPEAIAEAVLFLASDAAAAITGTVLTVDAGFAV